MNHRHVPYIKGTSPNYQRPDVAPFHAECLDCRFIGPARKDWDTARTDALTHRSHV